MRKDPKDEIRVAILHRQLLEFSYHGRWRKAEPHVLGISKNVLQVLCYQTDGQSSSGRLPHWRRFDVHEIVDLRVLLEVFMGAREPSGTHDATFDLIIEMVH